MKYRFLSILLALTLVLSLLPEDVWAADETPDPAPDPDIIEFQGFKFNTVTHTIEEYTLNSGTVVIPSQIEGIPVEKIAAFVFERAGMTSVTIPNTIKEIGESAFDGCSNLTTLIIQDGDANNKLSIGKRAFASTGITSLNLPARVDEIAESAFMNNDNLISAVVRMGINTFGSEVFSDCDKLCNVVIPGRTYNSNPFYDCKDLKIIHYLGGTVPDIPKLNTSIKYHPASIISSGANTPVDRCIQDGKNPETANCRNDDSCYMKIDATLYITANPHDTSIEIEEKKVSCTEDGSSGGKKCSVCKQIIVQPTITPALGHHYVIDTTKGKDNSGIDIQDSTCKDTGWKKTYMKCDRTGCDDSYVEEDIIEKKVDHSYTGNKTVDVGKGYNLKEPTCVEAGLEIALRICDDCEQVEIIDEKHIKDEHGETPACKIHTTRDVPALGHVKGEKWILDPTVPNQAYDCTKGTGDNTIHVVYQCTRCEKFPTDDPNLKAEIKVPAGEHSYGEPVKLPESTPPTCTEKGKLVTQRTCTVCGTKEGKVTKELDALGHNVTEWTTDKEPTCTEDGKRSGTCENPGCGLKVEEAIEKLGHDFESKDATKEETTAPTCTTEGVMTITCGRKDCGVTTTETIAMIPHTPTAPGNRVEKKAPTCTAEGIAHYDTSCKVCGLDLQDVDVPIPALGHDFGPWTTSGSTRTRTCKREGCGYTETDSSTTPSEPSDPSDPTNPSTPTNTYYSVDVIRPANGSISVSTSSARADTRVTVTLRPNSGYQLDSVWVTRAGSGRNVALSGNGTNRYTFIMPASRVEVRAVFSSVSGSSTSTNTTPPNDRNTNPTKNIVINIPQISSASTPAGSRVFVDVPSTFWAQGEIAWACQRGFISGSGGNFYPNNPITVRQLWMVMARMMGQNPANMEEARVWALNNGFADGGNPNAALTRLQLATMLYRCARLMGSKNTNTTNLGSFSDSRNIPAAAKNAMAWAVANGIITGTTDGRLNPSGTVSRAQFCVILYRYYQRLF